VSTVFCDTSVLLRAYLADEEDHEELARLVFEGEEPIVACELARTEFAAGLSRARRSGRLGDDNVRGLLRAFDLDVSADGPIALLALEPTPTLERARELVLAYDIGTLDAIHLSAAERLSTNDEDVVFCSRDARQLDAARAVGFELR
jgi:predicted nucleic acid-binding protein